MIRRFSRESLSLSDREILRYAGVKADDPPSAIRALMEEGLSLFQQHADCRACSIRCPVSVQGDRIVLPGLTMVSRDLSRNLSGCREAILFAATIGHGFDKLIARMGQVSPARLAMLDAVGSAAVEAWCDELCALFARETEAEGLTLRPRFSPGYGDLPLAVQSSLLQLLDGNRTAGITLTGSGLMVPRKSVSAIVGLSSCPNRERQ